MRLLGTRDLRRRYVAATGLCAYPFTSFEVWSCRPCDGGGFLFIKLIEA